MTRADELLVIEKTKGLLRNGAACAELANWWHNAVSDDLKMAMQDAKWDALGEMPEGKQGKRLTGTASDDMIALLLAANLRCLATHCPHVVRSPAGLRYFFLAPRLCSCKGCLTSFSRQFEEHDAKQDHAGECDLCLIQGVRQFHEIHMAWNGAVYIGDVCPSCRELFLQKS